MKELVVFKVWHHNLALFCELHDQVHLVVTFIVYDLMQTNHILMNKHLVNVYLPHRIDVSLVIILAHVTSFQAFHNVLFEVAVGLAQGDFSVCRYWSDQVQQCVLVVCQAMLTRARLDQTQRIP